ncbi:MAG TPA: two-component regulator propeller domain-containing protein [Thermoanaerobaculia bacterium]|nr:two-component regulator propeller domain-containing protein [Thermoanaerobaculia bacterium]
MTLRPQSLGRRLAALALWLGAACLPPAAMGQNRVLRGFSMADGLVHPQVYAIAEDRDGFLWIGTWEGVSRFDGITFTSYHERDGVPLGRVFAFHQAPDGHLYLAGDGGAAVFDGRRFLPLTMESGLAGSPFRCIAGRPDGSVVLGGEKGLVTRRPDGRWETLSDVGVTALLSARDGTLLAGTRGHGLLAMGGGRLTPVAGTASWPEISALNAGDDGTLYVGTSEGLTVLRGGSFQWPATARRQWIQSIARDGDGVLYLATKKAGVLRLRAGTLEPLPPLGRGNGLSNEWVHAVHAVRDGPVFLGTDEGLDVFGGEALTWWTRDQGLLDGTAWSLAEDARGDLYAALLTGGVAVLRGSRWRPLGGGAGPPAGRMVSVHAGRSDLLYAGDDQGRVWISRRGHPLRRVELPGVRVVSAILEGPGNEIYAATLEGFAVIRGDDVRILKTADGLPGLQVYALAPAADGTLYLATDGGLAAFRDGAVSRVWTRRDGLADDWVLSVRVGRDGSVYAGTRRGLAVILPDGRVRTYRDLTNGFVNCILEGGDGRLYLSTNQGVNVLDLHASGRPGLLPISGIGHRTGNTGACLRDRGGRLWFGMDSALTRYDPARSRPPRRPRALLTGLHVFKDWHALPARGAAAPFPYDRNDLTFSFTGIDLGAYFMRFRYRLAGLDREWTETGQRSVRYPSLPPGDYRFEVVAVNDAGLWSAPARLAFTVLAPPWWRRPERVLGLAALGIALAAGLYAAGRMRRLLEMERLRAAIAADLHDQVGAGLTDIAILTEVATRRAGDLPELARIAATARELVDGLGDIVWLVNPRRDSLYELFLRLKDSYAELFAHAGAQLEVGDLSAFEGIRLSMPYRQDLHLLFKEALRNALRHSGCRRAELSVSLRGRRLEVTLRDDGRGFDPERRHGDGEGLESMRRRAGRLRGRLTIDSSPGGTLVRFAGSVP